MNMFSELVARGQRLAYLQNAPVHNPRHPANWQEDYFHENGEYHNRCRFGCERYFIGHKRRGACRECAAARGNVNLKENPHWMERELRTGEENPYAAKDSLDWMSVARRAERPPA